LAPSEESGRGRVVRRLLGQLSLEECAGLAAALQAVALAHERFDEPEAEWLAPYSILRGRTGGEAATVETLMRFARDWRPLNEQSQLYLDLPVELDAALVHNNDVAALIQRLAAGEKVFSL